MPASSYYTLLKMLSSHGHTSDSDGTKVRPCSGDCDKLRYIYVIDFGHFLLLQVDLDLYCMTFRKLAVFEFLSN
jgi:hypothetical protein